MTRSKRAGALAALVAAAVVTLAPAPGVRAQGVDTTCVMVLTKTDPATVNVLFPDESAVYWTSSFVALPGARIRIQGEFPHARYASFNIYDPQLRPVDAIADAHIEPDPGSVNPFREGADRNAPNRSYTVYVVYGPKPEHPAPNTLYAGTGTAGAPNVRGALIYRVYTPDRGQDETGGTGIPSAAVQPADAGPVARSACTNLSKPTPPGDPNATVAQSNLELPLPGRPATETITWRKFVNLLVTLAGDSPSARQLGGNGGLLSNTHNAYVSAAINREFGKVVALRVKAPAFPQTRGGEPVMGGGQVRYFSICQNEFFTQRFIACAADDQTVLDGDGYATYVISTPEHRPAEATAQCGVTWLPWGPFRAGLLIYRHMLPADDFAESIQNAQHGAEAATMRDYLPAGRYYTDGAAFDADHAC